jgi:GT2 family glycosyltransferase
VAAIGNALRRSDIVASRFDYEKLNQSWTQKNCKWVTQQHKLERMRFHPHLYHAGSCGLGMRRWLHEAVGGFDETLPVLWDVDFCFQAQLIGARLEFIPEAVVHVRRREKLTNSFRQARIWAKYNVLMYRRYHTPNVKFRRPWRHYLFYWLQFLGDLKHARSKEDYAKLVWFFGWQIGLLQGAIRFWGPPLPI